MNISHAGRLAIRPNWYPVNSLERKTLYVIFLASYILIFSFSYGGWKLIMKNFWPIDFSPQHRKDHIVTIQFYTRWRREHSSVQFSRSVMSDSLRPHWLQHTRLPCPSPISLSLPKLMSIKLVMLSNHLILCCPLLLLPSIFPSIRGFFFPMSQFFTSGGQSIGVLASVSVLPVKTQNWSPLGLTGWISLQSKGLSRVFSNTTVQKHQFLGAQLSF